MPSRNLRSCGTPPMSAPCPTRQRAPSPHAALEHHVGADLRARPPIVTAGPIRLYGPTTTPARELGAAVDDGGRMDHAGSGMRPPSSSRTRFSSARTLRMSSGSRALGRPDPPRLATWAGSVCRPRLRRPGRRSARPTWRSGPRPPRSSRGRPLPPAPPAPPGCRSCRSPTTPTCETRITSSPTSQLWPIWTRLSILVPRRSIVSPSVARSIVVLAPISTSSSMRSPPTCGILRCAAPVEGVAEAVGAEHRSRVDDDPVADERRPRATTTRGWSTHVVTEHRAAPDEAQRPDAAPRPDDRLRLDHGARAHGRRRVHARLPGDAGRRVRRRPRAAARGGRAATARSGPAGAIAPGATAGQAVDVPRDQQRPRPRSPGPASGTGVGQEGHVLGAGARRAARPRS